MAGMDHSPLDVLGPAAVEAIFTSPHIDGIFEGNLLATARELGRRRPLVLLAFAPRTAGTFLRTAAIEASQGQLMRFAHAEGGRDASLYLPWLLAYFRGALTADTAVTHVHMPAATANRHLIEAFDLHPVVMRRSICDSLKSLLAMIEDDPQMPIGFSFLLPPGFAAMPAPRRADILIDVMGPWYAQFYASWKAFAEAAPDRVLFTDYRDFCSDPADVLEQVLAHARAPQSFVRCEQAIATVWQERALFRCNRERPHHQAAPFTAAQLLRLERFVSYYATLDDWHDFLVTPTAS
jgi:hypothetical protein